MKLTIFFSLAVCLQVSAKGGYAQKITLSEKNASLESVFKQIKKQSNYLFLYTREVVQNAKKVSFDAKDASVEEVLAQCFKDQPLVYTIVEKTVIIKPLEASTIENPVPPIVVTGVVTDSAGKPLPGVTVLLKGGKTQALTDAEGKFKINVPSTGSVLVFSSIGYAAREMTVGQAGFLSVSLKTSHQEMNEVVVTGFGESRARRTLGYSVTQVSGETIRSTAQINPINALQGMVAGLQVQPGVAGQASSPKILLRGANSLLTYENTPLVVVDGVILDDQSVTPAGGGGTDFGNILKDLNPDDIESLSVLKGGAVTALYGSRAGNGVLLIKTKKGMAMKGLGISLSQTLTFDKAYKTTDFQNVYGNGAYLDDWVTGPGGINQVDQGYYGYSFGPKMTGQPFQDLTGWMRNNNPNPHGLLDLFQTGQLSNTNLSLSGGNETSTIRMSYSRLSSNTVLPINKFDRNSFTVRATHKIGSFVTLDGNASYVHSYNRNPPGQGGASPMYQLAYDAPRNYDTKYWSTHYADSAVGGINNRDISGVVSNSLWPLYENKQFQNEDNLRAGIDLVANIQPWLVFNGNASMNLYNRNYEADHPGQNPGFNNPYYNASVTDLLQARYRGDFTFSKRIEDFSASLRLGGEVFTSGQTGASWNTNGGVLPGVYRLSNSSSPPSITENKPNKSQLSSTYAQATLGYHDYLSLNLYGREDWNSSLVYNDGHGKYAYFYGGADAAFVFTDLIRDLPKFITFGKLRMSYATTGNGTDNYTTNTGSYTAGGAYNGGATSVNQYSYGSTSLANQALIPEKGSKIEAGLEFRLFHNRLGADVTVYQQDTKDQIINFSVPSTSGVTAALLNGGLVRNRGIELSLSGTPIQNKDFRWDARFVFSHNSNTVLSLPFGVNYIGLNGEDGISTVAVKNGQYGEMVASYGYARYQAKDNSGNNTASALNGQHVLGMTGSGTQTYYIRAVNYGTTPLTQQPALGSINPWFLGSLQNTFTYKGFSLGIFLDARFGGIEWSTTYFYGSQTGAIKGTLFGRDAAHGGVTYTPTNATSQYLGFPLGTAPRNDGMVFKGIFAAGSTSVGTDLVQHDVSGMTWDQAYKLGYVTPVNAADYYVKKFSWSAGIREAGIFENSWVSLRQVSLGYDLPSSFAHKIKLNNLKVSLVGRNLVYLYNSAPNHINPENSGDTGAGSAFEDGGVPYVRTYGFMLNTNL
ncbi:MAG: SusC/RagA family TonB-linked outer membrane protein [Puia sp.]|nr:SusC/RagA family TonB-linked outer membrane protein [Puia sp.]